MIFGGVCRVVFQWRDQDLCGAQFHGGSFGCRGLRTSCPDG